MFKKILLVVAAVAIAFVSYVALQPSQYLVVRETTMAATPAAVFDQVNDLKKWEGWSPWAKLDPNAKSAYEGPSAGKDAVHTWSGDDKVGEGRMTIIESKPTDLIRIKLDVVRPYPGTSDASFAFKRQGDKTLVSWSITGEQGFVERAIFAVMGLNMDKMIGADFEKGLASLKSQVRG